MALKFAALQSLSSPVPFILHCNVTVTVPPIPLQDSLQTEDANVVMESVLRVTFTMGIAEVVNADVNADVDADVDVDSDDDELEADPW